MAPGTSCSAPFVALGADMGDVIDNSALPMEMMVDYVRVYTF